MSLSLAHVQHVASLARLALKPDEETQYAGQLSAILEAVEVLNQVDTSHVEPTSHLNGLASALRDDVASSDSQVLKAALASAPATVGTAFSVPKIIE